MTENKRFTTVELPKPTQWGIWYDGAYLSTYQVCTLLNEYVDVKNENEQLHSELAEKDIQLDYLQNENKHFKQRNDRQAKRLDELYSLIEREDWQTLKGIIQEFQECEEQLQKEWKCYCE